MIKLSKISFYLVSAQLIVSLFLGQPTAAQTKLAKGLKGRWIGELEKAYVADYALKYEFFLDLTRDSNAFCRMRTWGKTDWPLILSDSSFGKATFIIATPNGRRGELRVLLDLNGEHLQGTYIFDGTTYNITLKRADEADEKPKHNTDPPFPPLRYKLQHIKFQNGNTSLAGILTIPDGTGPHPSIVFAPGSRPNVSEPEIPGNPASSAWQWAIADHLTRAGVATLQMDDRGCGGTEGVFCKTTLNQSASDIQAAIRFIKEQRGIKIDGIGLLGHSLGATVAAIAAVESKDVEFLVVLSPAGRPGDEVLQQQRDRVWANPLLKDAPQRLPDLKMRSELLMLSKQGKEPDYIRRILGEEYGRLPSMEEYASERKIRELDQLIASC